MAQPAGKGFPSLLSSIEQGNYKAKFASVCCWSTRAAARDLLAPYKSHGRSMDTAQGTAGYGNGCALQIDQVPDV